MQRRTFKRPRTTVRFRRSGMATSQRKADRPKWNVGNFNINSRVSVLSGFSDPAATNVVVPLAMIPLLTPEGDNSDRFNQRMLRSIEIGGIVWTAGMDMDQTNMDQIGDFTGDINLFGQQLLVTDTVNGDGVPNSVLFPWHLTTQPTTTTASLLNQDHDSPQRILDRWADHFYLEYGTRVVAGGTSTTFIQQPLQQATVRARRERSKRLRLRLDPEHVLQFVFVTSKGPVYPVVEPPIDFEREILHWVIGTIYYRYRF